MKTSVPMVRQPHGGALRVGGSNRGGTGRPKDEVREKLIDISQGKGIEFLTDLMEGKVSVRLVGKCEHCQAKSGLSSGDTASDEAKVLLHNVRASVDQRLKALDIALKYGNAKDDEIDDITKHPDVKRFLAAFHTALAEKASQKVGASVRQRVDEILGGS